MKRSSFRLNRPLKAAVYLTFGLLLLTGAVWMYAQSRLEEESWEKVPRVLMQIHGGLAMLSMITLGSLTAHVRRGWSADKNRLSGVVLLGICGFLIVTGYGLYYAGGEDLRAWCSRWHWWVGVGLGIILPAHVIAGRLIIRALHDRRHPIKSPPGKSLGPK